MFERKLDVPCAIACADDPDDEIRLAWRWIREHDPHDGRGTVLWIPLKKSLSNNRLAEAIATRTAEVATSRGGGYFGRGRPVIALWPDIEDVAAITFRGCTALAVVPWNQPLAMWAGEAGAQQLGGRIYADEVAQLNDATVAALDRITSAINHSNTISAGFDKRDTIVSLQDLHDRGHRPDPQAVMEWAAAHGWDGDNVKRLGEYVRDINSGKRPKTR